MPAAVIASYAKEYKVPKKKVEEFWATAKKEYGEDYEKVSGTTKKMCQNYSKSKKKKKEIKESNIDKLLGIFEGNVPDKHQKKIAIDTIKNPDKALLGGPSVKEAEEILKTKFGYTQKQIDNLKESIEESTEALDTKMKVSVKKAIDMMKKMYPKHKTNWDRETLLFDVDGKLHGQWENGTLYYKFKKSEEKK